MENENLALILFLISILAFMLAIVLIVPNVLEEQKLKRKNSQTGRKWYLPFHRFKRNVKKWWNALRSPAGKKTFLSTSVFL
ncbi:hypothetical protein [Muriicola sp.]|uniref:hypothetical protein n=1 Tax=Muriicola sp. TaxID=2020856 RepID=UPI003561BFCA